LGEGEQIHPIAELAEGLEHLAERDRGAPILIEGLGSDDENLPVADASYLGGTVAGLAVTTRARAGGPQLHMLLK
jgi:hypothetical protein